MPVRPHLLSVLICGLVTSAGSAMAVTPEEYIHSGVIPLPAHPPAGIKELVGVLEPYSHLNSRLVDAQIAGWLRLLTVEQLQALQASIPSLWNYGGPDMPMDFCGLREMLPEVIAVHPELPVAGTHPLTAIEAGRRAGKDWRAAMDAAMVIDDPKSRTQYLFGLLQSAENASTYAAAVEIRDLLIPLLPDDERTNFETYEVEKRTLLWPAASIAAWVMSQPEDQRSRPVRFVLEHGSRYFADLDEAAGSLPSFGESGAGIAESMASVLAARDPAAFLAWWLNLPETSQSSAISHAIVPLLRRDATLIQPVLSHLKVRSLVAVSDVTQAWYRYDPAAALKFCSKLSDFKNSVDWWIPPDAPSKPIEPSLAIDLINQYPVMRRVAFSVLHFDPRRHQPETYARDLLRLVDPKTRETALGSFGADWGYHDAPAALAWTPTIPHASDRRRWLQGLAFAWIAKSPDQAAKALETMSDLDAEDRTRFEASLAARRELLTRPQPPVVQSRFAGRASQETLSLPNGGSTDPEALQRIRHSLADLAHPAEPPISDLPLCVEVAGLGVNTVIAMLRELEAHPPTDARENAARTVLLERWAMAAPEAAARWVTQKGNGTARQALPLALSKVASVDAELASTLADQIPEEELHQSAQSSILYALARRSHREACDFGEKHRYYIAPITRDWLRADQAAADSWLQARWLDRNY